MLFCEGFGFAEVAGGDGAELCAFDEGKGYGKFVCNLAGADDAPSG